MYLSNVESISETKCDNLPCKVRNKLLCLSGVVPDDFTKSCWIGGAHPFATNYFSSKEIQELSSNCDHGNVNGEELSEVLMGLRLWESKTITFYGEIVEVICCKTGV